jgi:hypothetical protein
MGVELGSILRVVRMVVRKLRGSGDLMSNPWTKFTDAMDNAK